MKALVTLLKKRLWYRCFPVNFAKFLRTPFFTEHLWWLLQTDFYHTFFTDEIIRGKSNEPVALSSHFGWVLSGNYKVNEKQKPENTHTFFIGNESFCKYEPFNDDSLEMENCFSHIYPNDIKQTSDEENVFYFYKRNLSFDGKRYKVKLSLKTHYELLPNNYCIAKSRFIGDLSIKFES